MEQTASKLAPYEERLNDLREKMIRTIGVHTLNVLLERAIYEAAQTHPELGLIEQHNGNLSFTELEKAYAGRPESDISNAFNDLNSDLLLILARLLGKEMAERLAQELQARQAEQVAPTPEAVQAP